MGKSSGSSGNTSTTTSSNSPPSAFTNAYTNTYDTAQAVSNTPYQQYTGNLVAGLSPDTSAGITSVENSQGISDPYINSAAQYINASTTPLAQYYQPYGSSAMSEYGSANNTNAAAQNMTTSGGTAINANDISQYESPYTQQVVGATQAEFNNQNQQQSTQLAGNAVSNGAFGGDREAVAQSSLAGQQQLSQAPTIASLENQGYSQAVSTAEQQKQAQLSAGQGLTSEAAQQGQTASGISGVGSQVLGANEANSWLNSQAGYGMANLGSEAQSSALTGANALLSVGTTEQNQAQSELNVPYEQYTAQQSYPFQTTSWLSGIASGLGSNSGGTSTSSNTSNSGNSLSSILGTGLTTAGLANSAFSSNSSGSNNGLSNIFSSIFGSSSSDATNTVTNLGLSGDLSGLTIKRGGAVPHRASGGSSFGVNGQMSKAPDQTISLPTGNSSVPDVSLSYVPSANTGTGGTPLILGNYGTTSTTTGGGGSSGSSALGSIGSAVGTVASIASLFAKDGGAVKGMRPANDSHYGSMPRRASGGSNISVTMVPGSYAGSQSVPMLSHSSVGDSTASGSNTVSSPIQEAGSQGAASLSSNPTVQSYLSSQQASASFAPATTYNPSTSSYGPAGHTTAAPAATTSSSSSSSTPGSSGEDPSNSDIAWLANLNNQPSSGAGAGGGARGGNVRKFADGGGDYDDGGLPPSKFDDQGLSPQVGESAGMMPDVGAGVSMGQGSGAPEPSSPQAQPPTDTASSEAPQQGPMIGMANSSGPSGGGMQPPEDKGPPKKQGKDWGELMTLIGANMMAGRSGNAFQNIGSGIAKGMQQYESEEAVAQRLSNQADNIARQLKQGDAKQATNEERAQNTANYQQGSLDVRNRAVDARQEYNSGSLAVRNRVADIQQQRADQGQQRLGDQEADSLAKQQLTQQKMQMQDQVAQNARTDKERAFAQRGTGQQLSAALNWMKQNTSRDPYTGEVKHQPSIEEAMGAIGAVLPSQQQSQQGAGRQAPTVAMTPPDAAISALKANPGLAGQFHQKYGVDPQQYLGTSQGTQ